LNYLWSLAGLSFTPKIHGILAHAADQVEFLGGIGDMLEDIKKNSRQNLQNQEHSSAGTFTLTNGSKV
jgi:hypothetical protein